MYAKNKKLVFKQLVTNALLLIVLFVSFSYATENKVDSSKKYYKIINPTNGVKRILNEEGKTIVKTETGYPNDLEAGRQDDIGIITDVVTNDVYFYNGKRLNTYNLSYSIYDEKMNMILSDAENVSIKNRVISYYDYKTKDSYEYNINTKEKIKKSALNIRHEMTTKNEENVINTNAASGPGAFVKNDNTKKDNANQKIAIDNDLFSLTKKENGKFTFISKKYNYFLDDINKIYEYDGVFNQKVNVYICDKWRDYVSEDGKLLMETYCEGDRYSIDYNIKFIGNKYIYIAKSGRGQIYEYADTPVYLNSLSKNTDYNIDIVLYGKKCSSEFKITSASRDIKFFKHDGNYYLLVFRSNDSTRKENESKNSVIDFKGNDCSGDFILGRNHYIYKSVKKDLYTYNGEKVVENLSEGLIYDLADIPCTYEKMKNCCYVIKDKKFVLVDEKGKVLLDKIDNIYPFVARGDGFTNCDPYLTINANGYIGLYDENMNPMMKDIDKFEVWRSGEYYLIKKRAYWSIYNKKAEKVYPKEGEKQPQSMYLTDDGWAFKEGASNFCKLYGDSFYYDSDGWIGRERPLLSSKFIRFNDVNGNLLYFDNGKYNLVDSKGNILLENYKYLAKCDDKWYLYQKGFKYGLIDEKGNKKCEFSIFDDGDGD